MADICVASLDRSALNISDWIRFESNRALAASFVVLSDANGVVATTVK